MAEITLVDSFGKKISETISKYGYKRILELGSWSGEGSTQCILDGLFKLESEEEDFIFQCVEINPERYVELIKNTRAWSWILTYNMSSIGRASFIPKSFDDVWNSPHNHLMEGLSFPRNMVEGWYNEDIPKLPETGFLESEHKLDAYDFVLLDGSEFLGYSEYVLLKDITQCFALDDSHTAYKTVQARVELMNDPEWELLFEDTNLRNGCAIFRRQR